MGTCDCISRCVDQIVRGCMPDVSTCVLAFDPPVVSTVFPSCGVRCEIFIVPWLA